MKEHSDYKSDALECSCQTDKLTLKRKVEQKVSILTHLYFSVGIFIGLQRKFYYLSNSWRMKITQIILKNEIVINNQNELSNQK